MAKKRKKAYVNNAELREEIIKSKEQGSLTRKAIKMLVLISERAQWKLKYENDQDREDCRSFAQLDLFRYWDRYDPWKINSQGQYGNAFAYYTTMCIHGYAKGWNKLHPDKYKGTVSLNSSEGNDGIYSL